MWALNLIIFFSIVRVGLSILVGCHTFNIANFGKSRVRLCPEWYQPMERLSKKWQKPSKGCESNRCRFPEDCQGVSKELQCSRRVWLEEWQCGRLRRGYRRVLVRGTA